MISLLFCLAVVLSAIEYSEANENDPLYYERVIDLPEDYTWYLTFGNLKGLTAVFSIEVVSGSKIDVFVMNSMNFAIYIGAFTQGIVTSWYTMKTYAGVTTISFEFKFPDDDTYYIVIENAAFSSTGVPSTGPARVRFQSHTKEEKTAGPIVFLAVLLLVGIGAIFGLRRFVKLDPRYSSDQSQSASTDMSSRETSSSSSYLTSYDPARQKVCGNCMQSIPRYLDACPRCGFNFKTKQIETSVQETTHLTAVRAYCPFCGEQVSQEARFCPSCRQRL